MFRFIFPAILIVLMSCHPKTTLQRVPRFSPKLVTVWKQYIKQVQKDLKENRNSEQMMALKQDMVKLYFQHRDQYSDFPDDLALSISRTLNQLDQHTIEKHKLGLVQQSIDLLPRRIVDNPLFTGTPDDGATIHLKLRHRKLPFKWPLGSTEVTSPYGMRKDPFTGAIRFHHGIDFGAPKGTPVYAASSGQILYAGKNGGYGLTVIIQHSPKIMTLYGHLYKILVAEGMELKGYRKIGLVGSTGRSTGSHLHFEVRRGRHAIDPVVFIQYQKK